MSAQEGGQPTEFQVQVPPELEPGVYANFLGVWHSPYEFTLDFAVTQPPEPGEDVLTVPCRVVARIKMPVSVIFDVIRTLNDNMTKYEQTFGEIHRPASPTEQGDPE
jgi:hypothetical protein